MYAIIVKTFAGEVFGVYGPYPTMQVAKSEQRVIDNAVKSWDDKKILELRTVIWPMSDAIYPQHVQSFQNYVKSAAQPRTPRGWGSIDTSTNSAG